jgi:UDP-glucose 4-epimerase
MICDRQVLITGGAGFIGSHVAERLALDNTVTILDDFSTGRTDHLASLSPERTVDGSVENEKLVRKLVADHDIIVHMAAMMGVRRTLENPLGVLRANIDGTRTVLKAAAESDVERVLFASTSEVYGDVPDVPYHEDDRKGPETNYAVAKQTSERFVHAYATEHGLEYTIVRYFNAYGPRQDSSAYGYVIPIFIDRALAGDVIEIHGDGQQTRDFTYIDDAVDGTIAALEPAGRNETFNIGTGTETNIRRLAITVADAVPDAAVTHVEHPRPYVIERRCADISRARTTLDYGPTTTLERGIEKTVDYLERNRAGAATDRATRR